MCSRSRNQRSKCEDLPQSPRRRECRHYHHRHPLNPRRILQNRSHCHRLRHQELRHCHRRCLRRQGCRRYHHHCPRHHRPHRGCHHCLGHHPQGRHRHQSHQEYH